MKSQISPQDYELISAFLDGELKGSAARDFESRLEKAPDLKAALREIQAVRTLVREMPRLRAPHAFTLSPQMVKVRKPGFFTLAALRTMQFSAALSGILLILVIAGDLILSRFSEQPALAPQAPAAAIQLEAAPSLTEIQNEGMTDMATGAAAEETAREHGPAPTATVAAVVPAAPAAPKMLATVETEMFEAAPPGGVPEQAPLPSPLPASTAPPPTATTQVSPEVSKDEADTNFIPAVSPQPARPAATPYRSLVFLVEILLAAISVVSIIIALFIRRSLPNK